MAPVDRAGRRQRAAALCIQSRSTRRSTRGTTIRNLTVGPVDRKGKNALSYCQQADLFEVYKYPILWLISPRISSAKFLTFTSVLQQVFKTVLSLKIWSLFCFKGLKISKKRKIFGNWFDLHLHFYLEFFPRVFLCVFVFQSLFSHTWAIYLYHIY